MINFLVPPFSKIACFNTRNDLLTDLLGDFRDEVKENKAAEAIAKCSALAVAKGYKLFALGQNGRCRSGPKAQDEYHAGTTTKDANCPQGIGSGNRIAVYTFGESSNISKFYPISKHPKLVWRMRGAVDFFLANFKVFGDRMKHAFECLI